MAESIYTAMTFAPVQGFIEKSRKLRDLYGSSFVLSYLARALCDAAHDQGCTVISPALINLTQGTPNQIIIRGNFPEASAEAAFHTAWQAMVEACRQAIEKRLPTFSYKWKRAWDACANHAWEFFWAQTREQDGNKPDRIGDVRRRLNEKKRSRAWIGINWNGESSTLSGADAIAWHSMTEKFNSKTDSIIQQTQAQKEFYQALSREFSDSIIAPNERLSIPELIKRLITLDAIADKLNLEFNERPSVEIPNTFRDLNRHENQAWTGWFQGDGDRIGQYLKQQAETSHDEAKALNQFSQDMMDWGKDLKFRLPPESGRIIYAGGDDFLGVLYRNPPDSELSPAECLNWFCTFNNIWKQHGHQITVSVGFVWAAPNVPQRDVLQHCREAEQSAKRNGRDRIAFRILFNGGNTLEWVCPWRFLPILKDYRDRNRKQGSDQTPNWTHIYQDVATLEARHAFHGNLDVARSLFDVYFPDHHEILYSEDHWWNNDHQSGILGNRNTCVNPTQAMNRWMINLAKVGFHLSEKAVNTNSIAAVGA
jgi:CRISPR-associated protein Cmr2